MPSPDPATTHFYRPAEGHGLTHDPFNAIISPRPIGWIGTCSKAGINNLAPYSFFNGFNYHPPIVGFGSIGWKDSVANIAETKVFTWNLATRALAEAMNASCARVSADVDEFALAGLEPRWGSVVDAPRVAESPVSFECALTQIVRLNDASGADLESWLVLGEVIGVHIQHRCLRDGVYDTFAAEPIARLGGPAAYLTVTPEASFQMERPR